MNVIKFPYTVKRGNSKVKIYCVKSKKSNGGRYYQVADCTKGFSVAGKPKRKLITFSDFEKARAYAEEIACSTSAGRASDVTFPAEERAQYLAALQLLEPSKTPLVTAAQRYKDAVDLLGDGAKLVSAVEFFIARNPAFAPSKSVPELIAEMISVKAGRGKSKRYLEDLRGRLGRFSEAFPVKLAEVDSRTIQNWLDGLGLSPQSYVNYRTVIGSMFSFAEARGYIPRGCNPVDIVERIKMKDLDIRVFTPAEFSALLNAADREFLPSLAIGGFAGLRSAEIQRLEWSDLQRGFITVSASQAKTGSRRNVPICNALAAWLAPFSGAVGRIWPGNEDGFANAQRRTAKAAGVQWKANALRHSYASYRLSELADAPRTAMELGNSPAVIHKHYKQLVRPEEAKEWFSIMPSQPAKIVQMPAAGVA